MRIRRLMAACLLPVCVAFASGCEGGPRDEPAMVNPQNLAAKGDPALEPILPPLRAGDHFLADQTQIRALPTAGVQPGPAEVRTPTFFDGPGTTPALEPNPDVPTDEPSADEPDPGNETPIE